MRHKTFELLEVKADGESGQFTALASVFDNVDLVGDRMLPGAFSKTLEKWRASGDPIPVVLSHQWDDPMAYVGKADPRAVFETDKGLVVQGQLDTSTPVGQQVYKLMKDRVLKAWSFGYTVPEGGEAFKDGVNDVSQVDLIEVGPTLKGANPEAQTLAVKAMGQDEPLIPDSEMDAAKIGELKAVWTTAYVNSLPDSAFLYVESGGEKDSEGKTTPRSLRHFPYKDDSGSVDLPHLRNALSRIPQSNLPQDVKDRLAKAAQRILDNHKSDAVIEVNDEEPETAKSSQDPLSKGHDRLAFELATAGIDMAEPPQVPPTPEPTEDAPSLEQLRRVSDDLMLETLIG